MSPPYDAQRERDRDVSSRYGLHVHDMDPTRRCFVLRGTPANTASRAEALLTALPDPAVLWIGAGSARFPGVPATHARSWLGRSVQVVVLDLHDGFDPDVLGATHGCIWAGGRLILRMPPAGDPPPRLASLAVYPFRIDQVGVRAWERLEDWLDDPAVVEPHPVDPAPFRPRPTDEQDALVHALTQSFAAGGRIAVVTADRGRGKSAAIGRALRDVTGPALVTSVEPDAVAEIVRFAEPRALTWTAPADALALDPTKILVIDEAARMPLPWLHRLIGAHPDATVVLATTTRGYEGTGRGFALRFVETWRGPRPLEQHTLHAPIRFGPDDPLERWVASVLGFGDDPRDPDLRARFGLLAEAHYRTTPTDLARILDAPNLSVFALEERGALRAISVVAREGGLPPDLCAAAHAGRVRLRGHALPDTLICHCGVAAAGELRAARSVRIATDPTARRAGYARRLVEQVHGAYDVDLFGTMFGATAGLVRFRQAVGYEVVRLGGSRGARTGEPSVVMVRPVSDAARALVGRLRAVLARELAVGIELLASDGEPLDDELIELLARDLPPPAPLGAAERAEVLGHWLDGPRPFEAAAFAFRDWVDAHGPGDGPAGALVAARADPRLGWRALARAHGLPSVPAAMRAVRSAFRERFREVRSPGGRGPLEVSDAREGAR